MTFSLSRRKESSIRAQHDSPRIEALIAPNIVGFIEPDDSEKTLSRLYAYPAQRPWVRSNMVSTLDGAVRGPDNSSRSINNAADMRVFRVLRALADVIVVGTHTASDTLYQRISIPEPLSRLREESGTHRLPQLAVVTRSGRLPESVLHAESEPIIVTHLEAALTERLFDILPPERIILAGDTTLELAKVPQLLADRGIGKILCEGGPSFLDAKAQADSLHELAISFSPLLAAGDSPRMLAGQWLMRPLSLELLLRSENTLMGMWRT